MEHILIKEYVDVIIERHPLYKSLNEKILEDVKMLYFYTPQENTHHTNIRGSQHNFESNGEPESLKTVLKWIRNLIRSHITSNFNPHPQRVINPAYCWLAKYNKGDYTMKHRHMPSTLSFVYFVKSPKGASPLVFTTSGKRISPEEGKVVIFSGNTIHHVPKNKCDGRLTFAGNLTINSPGH